MRKIISIAIILLITASLVIISGVSGCQKGTTIGTCEHGHDLSECPDGTTRCCLDGWVCCDEGDGENSCTPESFCS
jgi:hypothetical protein